MEEVNLSVGDFVLNHTILIAVFIISLYFVISLTIKLMLSKVAIIKAGPLTQMINNDENVLLFDMRPAGEFVKGHITGSFNVQEEDIVKDNLGKLGSDKSKPVVVIDKDGNRNHELGGKLVKIGFEKVYALELGVYGWAESGLPLVKAGGKKSDKK